MCTQIFTNIIFFHFKKTTKTLAVITAANTTLYVLVNKKIKNCWQAKKNGGLIQDGDKNIFYFSYNKPPF
jgi:hypothetical protein